MLTVLLVVELLVETLGMMLVGVIGGGCQKNENKGG